jgi:hypothetical protein
VGIVLLDIVWGVLPIVQSAILDILLLAIRGQLHASLALIATLLELVGLYTHISVSAVARLLTTTPIRAYLLDKRYVLPVLRTLDQTLAGQHLS